MMTKFKQAKERAEVLESIVGDMRWTKENAEENIRNYTDKIENAGEDEDMEYEQNMLEVFTYRLSVIQEVEKMLEKMI